MGKRRHKLHEEDLILYIEAGLRDGGFMGEDDHIIGFEYKTRTLKQGGTWKDIAEPGYEGPVEVVRWIVAVADSGRRRKKEEEPQDEPVPEDPA